jgi:hypothetical protein
MAMTNKLQASRRLFLSAGLIISGLVIILLFAFGSSESIPPESLFDSPLPTNVVTGANPIPNSSVGVKASSVSLAYYANSGDIGTVFLSPEYSALQQGESSGRMKKGYQKSIGDNRYERIILDSIRVREPTTLETFAQNYLTDFDANSLQEERTSISGKQALRYSLLTRRNAAVALSFVPNGVYIHIINVNRDLASRDEYESVRPTLHEVLLSTEKNYQLPLVTENDLQEGIQLGIEKE